MAVQDSNAKDEGLTAVCKLASAASDSDFGHSPEWRKRKGKVNINRDGEIVIKGGNHYVETKESYQRPFRMSVEMRQIDSRSPGCGMVAVFPDTYKRYSGYNAGLGFGGKMRDQFGVGTPKIETRGGHGATDTWNTVMIQVKEHIVQFYLNGELRHTVSDSKFQSGRVRLGNSCEDYAYRNVMVEELSKGRRRAESEAPVTGILERLNFAQA